MIFVELALVLVLILLNGFLAMSELAVVSSRKARLQALAKSGHRGAATALALAENPGRFLSTVQIGITLVGVLAGAVSGATLAEQFARYLQTFTLSPGVADSLALAIVVAGITYLSLVVGELVPKRIALRNAERVAAAVARPMRLLARLAGPAVIVLDASTRLGLRLFGSHSDTRDTVSEDEIKTLLAEAENAGVVEPEEKEMIAAVMRLGDRTVRAVMTPRRDVDWIDLDANDAEIRRRFRESAHSRLPAAHGRIDEVVGVVQTKDLLDAHFDGRPVDARALVRPAPILHDGLDALDALRTLKSSPIQIALVVDEYGTFEGIVTAADFLETIAGAFAGPPGDKEEPDAVRRDDGSWLFSGGMPADAMADTLAIPLPKDPDFHTVAGFVLARLKHLPETGERFDWSGWRFEVVDMDGRRIDKVLASRIPSHASASEE